MKKKRLPQVGIYVRKNKDKGIDKNKVKVIGFTTQGQTQMAVIHRLLKVKNNKWLSRSYEVPWNPQCEIIPFLSLKEEGYSWKYPILTIESVPTETTSELKGRGKRLVKKIQDYAKVLQHDTDGDFSSLINLMTFKLKRMAKVIESNDIVEKAPVIAKQMKKCAHLLEKVQEDDYQDEAEKVLTAIYGKTKFFSGETTTESRSVEFISWREFQDFENSAQIRNSMHKVYSTSRINQMRDLRKALNIMYRNILTWWD